MAEHRKFTSVICVKTGAKTVKIELFPAEQWGLESAQSRFRLRINRRWYDAPEGMSFLDIAQVGDLVAKLTTGESIDLAPTPDIPLGTSVSVPNGRVLAGEAMRDVTRTTTTPILAHDGEWYVGVWLIGKGSVFVSAKGIIKKQRR